MSRQSLRPEMAPGMCVLLELSALPAEQLGFFPGLRHVRVGKRVGWAALTIAWRRALPSIVSSSWTIKNFCGI